MNAAIDLALLSTFVEVAEASSFSRAARALGITTATASRDVAKLENVVGTRLLHRAAQRVSLTSAGDAMYRRTAPHVRALRRAAREVPEQQTEPAGTLKLTAPPDLGATVLADLLPQFLKRYPEIRIQAEFTTRQVDLAAEGFDAAVRAGGVTRPDLSWTIRHLVRKVEFQCWAAPSYVARRGYPHSYGSSDHEWLVPAGARRLLEPPKDFEPTVEANDLVFLRAVARAGRGIALVPKFIVQHALATKELVPILEDMRWGNGGLALVYSSARPLAPKIVAFRDFLARAVEKNGL